MNKQNLLVMVLYIDLSKKKFWTEDRSDLFKEYIGGAGVGIKLLHEECPEGADPYGSENPIIFAVGPLTGLLPLASKTVAFFKSPHTGNLGESHAGGRSAIAIRSAGYGAIVIRGTSSIPVYLVIKDNMVHFRDATTLWGMQSSFTAGRIIRQNESGSGVRSIMRIGQAGENKISYACVTTETYRHFGRLGLGAVFGSKKLKAIMVAGDKPLAVSDSKKYRNLYKDIYDTAVKSPVMKKYHDLGTPSNILGLNKLKGFPTRNLQQSCFEGADEISGENIAEKFLGRRIACSHCPVGCIHLAALREPYDDEPYFYKTSMISYDYELIYALGSLLGGSEVPGLLKLMDEIEVMGMDSMSSGVILAWVTEMLEKKLISKNETAGLDIKWGDYSNYIKAIQLIVNPPNDFYKALGKGVSHAAEKYGGKEFALSFGGNEMPGYHTGPIAHINYLTGARHSHLDSGGYGFDLNAISSEEELKAENVANALLKEERWRQILSSIVICFFARGIYSPALVSKSLELANMQFSETDLENIGKKILKEKYKFKFREGFSYENLSIPKRIFETESSLGFLKEDFIRNAVKSYMENI